MLILHVHVIGNCWLGAKRRQPAVECSCTHGCNFQFSSSQKIEYLAGIYSYRTYWVAVVMLVREFTFCFRSTFLERKTFFQYFYSSKIFSQYLHVYLSNIFRPYFYSSINWGVTFYFYLSTQYQYFAQHCLYVYSDNLLAHRTFNPSKKVVHGRCSIGDTFKIPLQIETLKKNWMFSRLSFTLDHISSIARCSNLSVSGGIEWKLHM